MPKRMVTEEALFEAINIWSTDFRTALMGSQTYPTYHWQFYEDAHILKQQLEVFTLSQTTIFDYVNKVFTDSGKLGYIDSIHFPALISGFKKWAADDDLPTWKPPADMPFTPLSPICKPQKKGGLSFILSGLWR